jgi:hypothetical protein
VAGALSPPVTAKEQTAEAQEDEGVSAPSQGAEPPVAAPLTVSERRGCFASSQGPAAGAA